MEFRVPENDDEVRWIAVRYEEIGALSIPGYRVDDEGIAEAEQFVRAQLHDESWRVTLAIEPDVAQDAPVGMLVCHIRNSPLDGRRECSIDCIHVEPEYRRHGLGRKILAEAEAWGRARDAARIRTYVARHNDPMHALCRADGFRETYVELCRDVDPSETRS